MSCPAPTRSSSRLRLTELPVGCAGRVCELEGEAGLCARLREIGFREPAVIEKLSGKTTLLCQISCNRIALSAAAAAHVIVELIQGRPDPALACQSGWL